MEGDADIDESMITGESRPVSRGVGDRVVAGTVATDSAIRVRVVAVGDDTALAGIQRLVADAQSSGSRAQALADRFAALLFYVAVAAGLAAFVVWWSVGDLDEAVVRLVTVLVVACPHALGLAIPLVIAISTAVSAKAGILVKDRLALERMRTVDTVLFDKTGTLTRGAHVVTGVVGNGVSEAEVLRLGGAVEADSEHPLARAIVEAARANGDIAAATGFRSLTGRGVEASINGTGYAVEAPPCYASGHRHASSPSRRRRGLEAARRVGAPPRAGQRRRRRIRGRGRGSPRSARAIEELERLGVRVVMITGDARQVADTVATQLGIDEVFAEVLPEDKDKAVIELQARGLTVAMVGDGVNDAPALARADVGLAIGAGTDVAIESAGVVLASSDPRSVVGVIRLSRETYRKMLQNLGWAAGYNIVAIPLAAGALAWAGITMAPYVAAILMSASTIVVAVNAQVLRRTDLRPTAVTTAI